MAVDQRALRALGRRLEEILGQREAETLMSLLPADKPATKPDLDALEHRLSARMDVLEGRVGGLEGRVGGLVQRIDVMERRLDDKIELKHETLKFELLAAFHEGVGSLRTEMAAQTKAFVFATVGALASIAALAFLALRFS